MATMVFCPECGKILHVEEGGEKKCGNCGKLVSRKKKTVEKKLCSVCGTDLSKKKRMKDSQGKYFCYDCGLADNKRKDTQGFKCTDCGRPFPIEKMVNRDGVMRCKRCYGELLLQFKEQGEREAAAELARKKELNKKTKWKKIVLIVVGDGLLLLFILWNFNLLPSFKAQPPARQPTTKKVVKKPAARGARPTPVRPAPARPAPAQPAPAK